MMRYTIFSVKEDEYTAVETASTLNCVGRIITQMEEDDLDGDTIRKVYDNQAEAWLDGATILLACIFCKSPKNRAWARAGF